MPWQQHFSCYFVLAIIIATSCCEPSSAYRSQRVLAGSVSEIHQDQVTVTGTTCTEQHAQVSAPHVGSRWTASHRSLVQFPNNSTTVNGSVVMTWPGTAFQTWCLDDSACSAATSATFALDVFTNGTAQWTPSILAQAVAATPALSNDTTIVNVRLVSDLAVVSLTPSSIKNNDSQICSTASPCEAIISFRVTNLKLTDTTVCARLTSAQPSGYTVLGYPSGTEGVRMYGSAAATNVTCATNQLGSYAVIQFTRVVIPSPPLPPASPPPPPTSQETGKPELPGGSVSIRFSVTFNMSFDTLTTSDNMVTNFSQDTRTYLIQGLAFYQPGLFQNASNTLPYYSRLTVQSISPGSVVTVYRVFLPSGVSDTQIDEALVLLNGKVAVMSLMAGSLYQGLVLSAQVLGVDGRDSSGWPLWKILVVVGSSVLGLGLLIAAVALFIRKKLRVGITPNEQDLEQEKQDRKAEKKRQKALKKDKAKEDTGAVRWALPAFTPPNTAGVPGTPISRTTETEPPPYWPAAPPPPPMVFFMPMVATQSPAGMAMVPLPGYGPGTMASQPSKHPQGTANTLHAQQLTSAALPQTIQTRPLK